MYSARIVRTYKKGDILGRVADEKMLALRGYHPVSEEEVQQYSATKGCLLALLFLPLALFGHTRYIKVTYERAL
jgi:hypothetical protein